MRTFILYHANCADGFTSYWVVDKAFQIVANATGEFSVKGIPGFYNKELPGLAEVDSGDQLIMVDFSLPVEKVQELMNKGVMIKWYDHHVSAYEMYKDSGILYSFVDYSYHVEKSGATIAWDKFEEVFRAAGFARPILLDHIEDRDLWKFRLPRTKELTQTIFSFKYSLENWDKLMSADAVEVAKLSASGEALIRKHNKDIEELLEAGKAKLQIDEFTVWSANLPYTMASDAAHILADNEPFAAVWHFAKDKCIFSLRSHKEGADVSKIAARFGGGGHKHAAGFAIPAEEFSIYGIFSKEYKDVMTDFQFDED